VQDARRAGSKEEGGGLGRCAMLGICARDAFSNCILCIFHDLRRV
jgi:hypothetical protein